ncbi:S1 family peptidase [Nocardia altamirensis]|uniref:S1 family peptidase n=1 Tax=Nocardia altamirensis TaxID=472158 RepID=UPI00083FE8D1|nr:S1 family peptidase [Nocardia altamirensis]
MKFGTRARRAALGCCVALAVAGSVGYPAAAVPEPDSAALPQGLIDAVKRDLGIDPAEYLQRVDITHRLAEFAKTARLAHPAAFAGIRMDGGRPVVSLTDGVSAENARAAAQAAGFAVESVADSEATLRNRRSTFERWLVGQSTTTVQSIAGYGIDVAANSLAVRLAKDVQFPAEVGPVRSVNALPLEARPDNTPLTAQAIAGEDLTGSDIVGGQSYAIVVGSETHRCSYGFNGTDADGNAVNITAGHCDPNNLVDEADRTKEPQRVFATFAAQDGMKLPQGEKVKHGAELGHFDSSSFAPHDYGILRINKESAKRFQNNLVSAGKLSPATPSVATGSSNEELEAGSSGRPRSPVSVGTDGRQVVRIDGTTEPIAGSAICKSGFRSGYSCGIVIAANQTAMLRGIPGHDAEVIRVEDMFYTTLCGHQGDSGGPIMAGTKAVGINSAIITHITPLDGSCGHLPVLLGQPISTVLRDNPGLTLRTK